MSIDSHSVTSDSSTSVNLVRGWTAPNSFSSTHQGMREAHRDPTKVVQDLEAWNLTSSTARATSSSTSTAMAIDTTPPTQVQRRYQRRATISHGTTVPLRSPLEMKPPSSHTTDYIDLRHQRTRNVMLKIKGKEYARVMGELEAEQDPERCEVNAEKAVTHILQHRDISPTEGHPLLPAAASSPSILNEATRKSVDVMSEHSESTTTADEPHLIRAMTAAPTTTTSLSSWHRRQASVGLQLEPTRTTSSGSSTLSPMMQMDISPTTAKPLSRLKRKLSEALETNVGFQSVPHRRRLHSPTTEQPAFPSHTHPPNIGMEPATVHAFPMPLQLTPATMLFGNRPVSGKKSLMSANQPRAPSRLSSAPVSPSSASPGIPSPAAPINTAVAHQLLDPKLQWRTRRDSSDDEVEMDAD